MRTKKKINNTTKLIHKNHSYLYINHVKVFQGHGALFQRRREKAQVPNTIEMKFRPLVHVPPVFIQVSCGALFCSLRRKLHSSELIMIQE